MNKRQLGKFRISSQIIQDSPDVLWKIMGTVIVIRAEYLYESDFIEYTALSHSFPPVGLGARIPWYKAVVNSDTDFKWVRSDE